MGMDKELLEAMPDTIRVYRFLGTDDHGNDRYAVHPIRARANITINEARGTGGDHEGTYGPDVVLTGSIICEPVGIKTRDRIEFLGHVRYVERVTTYRDAPERGDYVQEITFQEDT